MEESPLLDGLLQLDGQSVLVTGASGNIGQGIAVRLAEAGARVIVHYRNNEAAARTVAECVGGDVIQAELTDEASVKTIFDAHAPDLVVNNAAEWGTAALAKMNIDAWRSMHAANLDSAFLVTQRAARDWRDRGTAGAIVNVASIEALDPARQHAHYASSKAALVMFTRAAALEYGGDGIRINAVSPGLISRPGIEKDWPDGVERWHSRAPLTRLGTPNDVADAVLFLLSPAARWITGINLVVDGGMSSQNKW